MEKVNKQAEQLQCLSAIKDTPQPKEMSAEVQKCKMQTLQQVDDDIKNKFNALHCAVPKF